MEDNNEVKNETLTESAVMNNEEPKESLSNSDMNNEPNKRKTPKIIAITVVTLILIVFVLGLIVCATSNTLFGFTLFANKGQRFLKLLTTDQKVLDLIDTDIDNSQINSELKIDVDNIMKEIGNDDTKFGLFKLDGKEILKDGNFSATYNASLEGLDNAEIELQV